MKDKNEEVTAKGTKYIAQRTLRHSETTILLLFGFPNPAAGKSILAQQLNNIIL
jgi:hypothetical protein